MKYINIPRNWKKNFRETVLSVGLFALSVAILVIALSFAENANAQNVVNPTTSTTLWAGSLDTTQFGFTNLTLPSSGVILQGTAISAITGQPVRHLWYGDPVNGLCRVDPEVDAVIPATGGIGGHFVNVTSCIESFTTGLYPGQLAFDASTNTLYAGDLSRVSAGILRFHYFPSGDSGQGAIDPIHVDGLLGNLSSARPASFSCAQIKDPKTGNLVPIVPSSAAIGPDGNLYTGSIRDGAIIRIISPATFDPSTECPQAGSTPKVTDRIQIALLSADEVLTVGHTFGLGWIGHTLFGADNSAPWLLANADQCFTSLNGGKICGSPALGGQAPMPAEFLSAQVPGPQGGAASDAQYPSFAGSAVYFATLSQVAQVSNVVSATNVTVAPNYGGTFNFVSGLSADSANSGTVFVGADPFQGAINGAGQIWQVSPGTCPPAVPLPPSSVSGSAANSQATVSWTPTILPCQTISSYVVRTLLAGGTTSGVPDVTVSAGANGIAPTTATVTGLTNGVSYQFEVEACNLAGCSAFSALSSVVALLDPGAPVNVVAVAGNASATLAWTAPPANGGPAPTSYTASAFDTAAPTVLAAQITVNAPANGAVVSGLINGHCYAFSVHATNAVGVGPESALSLPVCPVQPTNADVSITMSGPASVLPGSILTYTMRVTNNGPLNVAEVTLTDTLPAAFSASTTTQGVCAPSGGVLSCNLGSLTSGSGATVTLSLSIPSTASGSVTNTATVAGFDLTGTAIPDPNTANNTAIATVPIAIDCSISTTDIQTTGSAQNGNPVHGTPDLFTWQIKNNQGSVTANCVAFSATTTAPTGASLAISSVSTTIGTCSIASNAVNCTIGTIPGGQTAVVSVTAVPSTAEPANSYTMTGNAQLGPGSTDTNIANNVFTVLIGAQ